jgi:hypothetical protein
MSCNAMPLYGRDRGSAIHGTDGTVILDRDGYEVHDLKGKMIEQFRVKKDGKTSSADLVGADSMTDAHFANFIDGIRTGAPLHSPIAEVYPSVSILLMANIAWETQRSLNVNPQTTEFIGDAAATGMRSRTYEKGWAPHL